MFRPIAILLALLSLGLAGPEAEAQPSFDCARAGTATEHAICGSGRLSALDREIAAAYAAARGSAGAAQREAIRADQRWWLGARDGCGNQPECLEKVMRRRLDALRGIDGGAPMRGDLTGLYCPNEAAHLSVVHRGDRLDFEFGYFGANGHSCGTPLMAGRRAGDGWVARRDGCELVLRQVGSEIVVTTTTFEACRQFCGARTAIREFRVPLRSRNPAITDVAGHNWWERGC
ncbi:lysozyme inhibitor LprI family protein [Limimaricola pyoseonensis]|uniref:Lysozyme inhibitor LprI-like N-terminal domain-containing protein n=1 Tax=Limimaricola pyoseonensis TaxID=521013 RepID=A0A1G7H122_9RHOB|nr:lysozyme inhibitor LprI family protein [Limimaricola pyoseonensis]SDE94041.1 hypothetical protein SAMN04488567_3022 [Limimaricola pyoseonensis]